MYIISLLGWFGTLIYLANHAYISSTHHWSRPIYYGANALAASLLVLTSFYNASWQAVVINGFWAVLSVLMLARVDISRVWFSRRFFTVVIAGFWCVIAYIAWVEGYVDYSILGWSSAFAFSGVYLLFNAKKLTKGHYLFWNAYAATTLLPQLWIDHNWPVFGLESSWAVISIYGIVKRIKNPHLID